MTSVQIEPALAVDGLTVDFETFRGSRRALDDVTVALAPGEIVGILGESGCGKSTLAKCILGILDPAGRIVQGSIRFQGNELTRLSEKTWQTIRGKSIGFLVSNARGRLNPLLGIGRQIENVIQEARPDLGKPERRERALAILDRVGIPDAARRFNALPHEFSGGMCQRVVIAIALVNEPKLLLADEPTSGLDVTVQRQILDLMRALVADAASNVVIMTRDPGVVAHYCQRAIVMRDGRIVEDGDVVSFFRRPTSRYSRGLLLKALAAQAGARRAEANGGPSA